MSIVSTKARLAGLTQELKTNWQDVQPAWNDPKCLEFEKTFLDPLFAQVSRTLAVLESLDTLISKARSDCE